MSIGVRVGGAWKDVNAASVRVGGAWKPVSQAYVKVSGVWKELLSSFAANFPVIASSNSSNSGNSLVSTHNVSMPTGIVAGDLLIVLAGIQTASITITDPVGWTQFLDAEQIGANTGVRLRGWYKIAAGSDTCSFSTSANRASAHNSYRISGYQGVPVGLTATGQNANPNPPSLSPSWGEDKTLWLSAAAVRSGTTANISSPPASYTDLLNTVSTTISSVANIRMGSARRELQAATEDPGNFTLSVSTQDWVAATVAIRPA